jgi:hypothetical protein
VVDLGGAGVNDREQELEARVGAAVHVLRRDATLRAASATSAVAAGAVLAGLPAVAALAGVAVVGAAWFWPRRPGRAIAGLEAAASLDGALACAWDHRTSAHPLHLAQRRRALRDLASREPVRPARRPSALWALPPLLWIGPILHGGTGPARRSEPGLTPAEVAAAAGQAPDEPPAPPSPVTAPEAVAARATSDRAPSGAPEDADAGLGPGARIGDAGTGGDDAPQVGGADKGGQAGQSSVTSAGRRGVALAEGTGAAVALASGVVPGPVRDDVADPARPYPRRFQPVITAWFDRARRP